MRPMAGASVRSEGFRWHPNARLFGPDGAEVRPGGTFAPLPDPVPGRLALQSVLAGAEGAPFRLGGTGALEAGLWAF